MRPKLTHPWRFSPDGYFKKDTIKTSIRKARNKERPIQRIHIGGKEALYLDKRKQWYREC